MRATQVCMCAFLAGIASSDGLGPPWPNHTIDFVHVCRRHTRVNFFISYIFLSEMGKLIPVSGPELRLDNTRGLWGLSSVFVSDFDRYNNLIFFFSLRYSSLLSVHGM